MRIRVIVLLLFWGITGCTYDLSHTLPYSDMVGRFALSEPMDLWLLKEQDFYLYKYQLIKGSERQEYLKWDFGQVITSYPVGTMVSVVAVRRVKKINHDKVYLICEMLEPKEQKKIRAFIRIGRYLKPGETRFDWEVPEVAPFVEIVR